MYKDEGVKILKMDKKVKEQIEQLYADGELDLDDMKKIRGKFTLVCNFCKSIDIAIITKTDDDGYCETCSSPYARVTIKCKECGQGISIRG